MSRNSLNLLALDFLRTLPREQVERWPVQLAVAQVYIQLKDWTKLEEVTRSTT